MNNAFHTCQHRPACDGCPLFEKPQKVQHDLKSQKLNGGLLHYTTLTNVPVFPIQEAPDSIGYRNRARMVTNPKASNASAYLGFYQRGSRTFLPIELCKAHDPRLESVLHTLRTLIFDNPLKAHTKFVDVRWLDDHAMATLCMGSPSSEEVTEAWKQEAHTIATALQAKHPTVGVRLNLGTKKQAIYSGEDIHILDPARLTYSINDERQVTVAPGAFFQLNTTQLKMAHDLMIKWLGARPNNVLDLYCGIGVHSLAIATGKGHIWGSDVNAQAISAAEHNASALEIPATYHAGTDRELGPWLETSVDKKLDAIIINPARAGVSVELIAALKPEMASAMLYLSCEPKTLRRDLARLVRQGWEVVQLLPMDFMPMTEQVETLALLKPAKHAPEDQEEGAFWPIAERALPVGVSGLPVPRLHEDDRIHWIAHVSGNPTHGQPSHLPNQANEEIQVHVLSQDGPNAWIAVSTQTQDVAHLCQRLRAWGFPVFGDQQFGKRASNQWFKRKHHGDRLALHCALVAGKENRPSTQRLLHHAPGVFFEWGLQPPHSKSRHNI